MKKAIEIVNKFEMVPPTGNAGGGGKSVQPEIKGKQIPGIIGSGLGGYNSD